MILKRLSEKISGFLGISRPPKRLSLEEIAGNEDAVIAETATPDRSYPGEHIDFVAEHFRSRVNDHSSINDIKVAAGEMIANAVEHGNRRDPSKYIKICCAWSGRDFYIAVQDEGQGFDIDNPDYPITPPREGTLGIYFTRQRMSLVYNFNDSASYACKRCE